MKNENKKTFIFDGLGFPIKLTNVPMRKIVGEWCIDINMNQLMIVVLEALVHKPTSLAGDELSFIRSYLQMTPAQFGKIFGISRASVTKLENKKILMSPSLELCIRLYVLNFLKVKDKEFRALFNAVSLEQLSKNPRKKVHPIAVDATTEELKIAL